jgi:hypothetical protein
MKFPCPYTRHRMPHKQRGFSLPPISNTNPSSSPRTPRGHDPLVYTTKSVTGSYGSSVTINPSIENIPTKL